MTKVLPIGDIRERVSTQLTSVVMVLLGTLVIALGSQFRVTLPFSPVPITAQTLAVMLVASSLGARKGALSVVAYIVGNALGLPWFAAGSLLGPTAGYLIGFVVAAWCVGALMHNTTWNVSRNWWYVPVVLLVGHSVIYAFGLTWLSFFVGTQRVLAFGFLPFLPGDLLKLVCATGIVRLAQNL